MYALPHVLGCIDGWLPMSFQPPSDETASIMLYIILIASLGIRHSSTRRCFEAQKGSRSKQCCQAGVGAKRHTLCLVSHVDLVW